MPRSWTHSLRWRWRFLTGENPFTLRERLRYIDPVGPQKSLAQLVSMSRRGLGSDAHYRLGGFRFYFQPERAMAEPHLYRESIELVLRESFLKHDLLDGPVDVNPGDVVLDLGGSIGTCALDFATRAGNRGTIYSFEPLTPELVERNARDNGFDNIHVIPLGVAEAEGEATFYVGAEGITSSIARVPGNGASVDTRTIRLTTVDDFVDAKGLSRVDLIKVDVEGAEELAIRGAVRTIERLRPRWTIASYHTDHVGEAQHPKLVRLLRDLDYRVREEDGARIFAW